MFPYIYLVLPSYGVLAFIGAFCAVVFLFFRIDRYKIAFTEFLKLIVCCGIGCIIGSKLLFALTRIPWLIKNFSAKNLFLLIPQSGLVFYGGLFGAIGAVMIMYDKDREKRDTILDMITPALPLFHGFGRIGCFMAGCCYGEMLSDPIVIFGNTINRMPIQLIEALFEFILFAVFLLIERKAPSFVRLKNYLVIYAVFRFIIEFWRDDEMRGIWLGGLSTSQIVSLIIVIVYIIYTVKTIKKDPSPSSIGTMGQT